MLDNGAREQYSSTEICLSIPLLPTAERKFKTGTPLKSVFLINRIGVVIAILYKVERVQTRIIA